MVKTYTEVEDHIQEALDSILTDGKFSILKLAKEFNVPEQQLQDHFKRTPS